jgi:hypothetical protein
MKKTLFVLVAVVMVATLLASCGPKAPSGEALVTVKGKIGTKNVGETYVLDQAAFDAKSVELTYNDPWMGDGLKYKGILLKDLITLVKPTSDVTTVSLVAVDGMTLDIALADAQNYDLMLARWVDSALLTEENGGPVKLAAPEDSKDKNGGPIKDENWMWWIKSVDFK